MNILFYPTVEQVDRDELQDTHAVVIDVLRTGSTVVAALENGARRIIPVEDIETASRLARPSERSVKILAGERRGMRVEGFDLGNSPLEFTRETIGGKTIIITTTNGTRGVTAASKSRRIIIGSINNIGAVAYTVRGAAELAIVCCGTEGVIAAEDMLCGGLLLAALDDSVRIKMLGDAARLALLIARDAGGGIEQYLRGCDSGRMLIQVGREADVVHCARRDISTVVPEMEQGALLSAD
jgi:2-phosphosulfolactate phosphatase